MSNGKWKMLCSQSRRVGLCNSPTRRQRFASDFFVVEMKDFAAENLIILVSLPRDQDQIADAGLSNRVMDRFAAVGDLLVRLACFLYADFGIGENLIGIFGARVVGSQDHAVAQRTGGLAH